MGNLRIKLKYKSFEIEIEGEEETVQAEFKDIKNNGLGNIVVGVDLSETSYIIENEPKQIQSRPIEQIQLSDNDFLETKSQHNLPTLKDVIMRQLPSSETEWILVYAHFASDNGTTVFTPKNILEHYESTKRKTISRHANLSKNIKSIFGKGYFSALNDDEYILTDDGKHAAIEILTRKHSSPISQSKPSKKSVKKVSTEDNAKSPKKTLSPKKFEVLKNVNFRPKDKISLNDYQEKYHIKSNADRIVVIISYLNDILEIEPITGNHIYSGFWEMKCKIPTSFYQIITNTKAREKFLDFTSINDIKLSVQGQNHIRIDILKK